MQRRAMASWSRTLAGWSGTLPPQLLSLAHQALAQVPQCSHGRMENHTRPRPTHDLPYLFPLLGSIAVDGTVLAGRLCLAPPAMVQPSAGIVGKGLESLGCLLQSKLVPTIDVNHQSDGCLVPFRPPVWLMAYGRVAALAGVRAMVILVESVGLFLFHVFSFSHPSAVGGIRGRRAAFSQP